MSAMNKLKPNDKKLVNRLARGSVAFLSGTVAPAKSNPETMNIESFEHAMEHYASRGVERVIVQNKFMGSRAQLYLWRDVEKCFAVSRNGFVIKGVDLKSVFQKAIDDYFTQPLFDTVEHLIVDGELMPWRTLADTLIDKEFHGYSACVGTQANTTAATGFYDLLEEAKNDPSKEKDHDKFSVILPMWDEEIALSKFEHQIELFGASGEPYFEAFNILKMVDADGEHVTMHDNLRNSIILGTSFVEVDPNNWVSNNELLEFLEANMDKELEGVVVKPAVFEWQERNEDVRSPQYAPYLKVRNPEYLRIVYGHDYTRPEKLEQLVTKKSIGRKVGASLKDYRLGEKLLAIPSTMTNNKNEVYKETLAEMLLGFQAQKELDPRL